MMNADASIKIGITVIHVISISWISCKQKNVGIL